MEIMQQIEEYAYKHSFRLYLKLQAIYHNIRRQRIDDSYGHFLDEKAQMPKYVVIRYDCLKVGIMCALKYYVLLYKYFTSQNMIPILDLEYAYEHQNSEVEERKNNLWDLCFEQIVTAEEVLKKNSVYITQVCPPAFHFEKDCLSLNGDKDDFSVHLIRNKSWREYYKKVNDYCKEWLKFRPVIDDYVKENYDLKINASDRVLGVSLREEFSKEAYDLMPQERQKIIDNHPRVPDLHDTMQIVKGKMKEWNCDKIFLATCYKESVELFQSEFGNKVFWCERERGTFDEFKIDFLKVLPEEYDQYYDMKTRSIQYVGETVALSKCDCFIGASSGGTIGAMIFNGGKYDEVLILEDCNDCQGY